ncbi:FkbM family methyltransferase [Pelagibacterales bacterium SAG-MED50]|nr:FkbM family methyltransferase [Pelagibacterales bacterium SAG-MED50]
MKKIIKYFQVYNFQVFKIIFRNFLFYLHKKINPKGSLLINIYNFKMLISLKYDGISKVLYMLKKRELDHKWMIDNELSPGSVVLDIGANIGYYLIMVAKKIGSLGKIYAIEPDPRNIELLKKNIKLNNLDDIVYLEEGAISNKDEIAELKLSAKTNINTFEPKKNQYYDNSIKVQKYDFGNYLKNKKRFDMVRMDIEGHEINIFDSLIRFSKNFENHLPKKIIFETHCDVYKKQKEYVRKILSEIFELGYEIKYFSSPNEPVEVLKIRSYYPFKIINDHLFRRGIYKEINHQDFIDIITEAGGIRTVMLELKK